MPDAGLVAQAAAGGLAKATAPVETRIFNTLDGMRGVAALVVAMLHTPSFTRASLFGDRDGFQCAFLGVDLFFVLSGFVIAHAYEQRLQTGMRLTAFLKYRAHRLAPLYVLGVLLAVAEMTASNWAHPGPWTPSRLAIVGVAALVMIPLPIFGFGQVMYLLNPATWTLAAELVVNLVYALIARYLTTPRLIGVCLAAGLGVAWVSWRYGTIDVGISWSLFPAGLILATYGFFTGVLMFRLHRSRAPTRGLSGWLWMGMLFVVLMAPLSGPVLPPYEVACALVLFPALVYAAACSTLGPLGLKICATAGTVSYALYVLHTPIGRTVVVIASVLHWNIATGAAGLALVALFVAVSWAADVFYDRPVRRWLKRLDRRRPPFSWPDRDRRSEPRTLQA